MSRKTGGRRRQRAGANAAWRTKSTRGGSRILATRLSTGLQVSFDVRYPLTAQVTFYRGQKSHHQRSGMYRRIALSFVVLAFVAAAQSDNVLKCYMCTSLTNEGCDSELMTSSVQPIECTGNKMTQWQRIIEQHNTLSSIKWLFEVGDTIQQSYHIHHMACSKMTFNVYNKSVIVRTCQTDKTDNFDPCKTMERRLENNQHIKMDKCSLCNTEACNSTTIISPDILYIFLSFLCSLIHVALYRLA